VLAFREALADLRVREQERRAREERGWETLHRVSAVLAGSQRTGRAGENVLRESLKALPPTMVVTDFRVGGRVVEFGLVLPDGRRLPVDSKWTADRELQALADCEDPAERERLCKLVERAVADRAREVSAYRDPSVTAPFGVAAVPDGAYEVLRRAHADAYRHGVIVVPYSMALPVLLFLYGIVARLGGAADLEACLADLVGVLDSVEATLENKVARATTMLVNGTEELRGQVGRARGLLAGSAGALPGNPSDADGVEPIERPVLVS
jgi:DNA recombination protein RmuC